jgi:hypothetical protein
MVAAAGEKSRTQTTTRSSLEHLADVARIDVDPQLGAAARRL